MKITEHFSIEEFACKDGTSYPPKWIQSRLLPLCEQLEVIRIRVGAPIIVSSGYRTPEYNKKIGGAKFSQHMEGRAADFHINGWFSESIKSQILYLRGHDLIQIGGLGIYPTFVHVDIRPDMGRLAYWEGSRSSN